MTSISQTIASAVAGITLADIPQEVQTRARHLLLDSIGVGIAASTTDFAEVALKGLNSLDSGDVPVIGRTSTLSKSGAAIANGLMIHGHDFDDTHIAAVSHVSASSLAAVISAAAGDESVSFGDLLLGYILAIEVNARLGMAADGRFHDKGFHPTGVLGSFGSAIGAGRVHGLTTDQLVAAQGIAGSFSSGVLQFLDEGAPTKRLHPGWAANAGLHAVSLAAARFDGPTEIYEGRFGLYRTHIQDASAPGAELFASLGEVWEVANVAVKPFPTCHFTHSFIDIATRLREDPGFDYDEIESITAKIHDVPAKVVCEPVEDKLRPRSEYDAKFSLPFITAAALRHGKITFTELDEAARGEEAVLATATLVTVEHDEASLYPKAFSSDLSITLRNGTVLHEAEQVNRGHESRPLTNAEVAAKFGDCTLPVIGEERTASIRSTITESSVERPAVEIIGAFSG
ncbi:MmgE/PrpD family protein [Brevibacterium marinum]|uniref:2-methylcitrate dehydratase PrpD n=1 Tax=Brevibacterium marinum TaxID=418643 RepID=A0A846RZJ1_9MICO|nr:MmgE/PrpD family protein [Brevibacterium marinum]NJC55381.1 2-methylcitrate dehydratase PrpD [Brevibacterium marinum]